MSSLLNGFIGAVNEKSKAPVSVISDTVEAIPPVRDENNGGMKESCQSGSLTIEAAAAKMIFEENKLLNNVNTVGDDKERLLTFELNETKLPCYFKSYDELAITVLGNIFLAEGLKSINLSYFGDFFKNINPKGYTRALFGSYEFMIQDNSDRMIYVFDFLVKAKQSLLSSRCFKCDLVKQVDLNYTTAYTLVLTPKEMMDIQRSYPDYKISYTMGDHITDLKLVIQAG